MLTVLARAARLLGAHWPALLAWILGGTLVHFLVLKLAAFVGAGSAVGGILPFVAFYAAWGFIADDVTAYINDATQWSFWWGIARASPDG